MCAACLSYVYGLGHGVFGEMVDSPSEVIGYGDMLVVASGSNTLWPDNFESYTRDMPGVTMVVRMPPKPYDPLE